MGQKTAAFQNRGMVRDLSISKTGNDLAFDNHNIRITARDRDTLLSVTNEKGNIQVTLSGAQPVKGTLLGHAVLNSYLVLFTHEDSGESPDHIYRIAVSQGLEWECVEMFSGNLGFDSLHPIETLPLYELEDIQKVYWVDGKNQPRVINIMGDYNGKDRSMFDFVPKVNLDVEAEISKVYSVQGSFPSGTVQYVLLYFNLNGQVTNPVYISPIFYSSPHGRGGGADETVACAFQGTFRNIDGNYDRARVIAVIRTSLSGTPSAYVVGDYSVVNETSLSSYSELKIMAYSDGEWYSDPLPCDIDITFTSEEGETEVTHLSKGSTVGNDFMTSGTVKDISVSPWYFGSTRFSVEYTDNDDIVHKFESTDLPPIRTMSFVDTGNYSESVDYGSLMTIGGDMISASTLSQKDNTLFLGGITDLGNFNVNGLRDSILGTIDRGEQNNRSLSTIVRFRHSERDENIPYYSPSGEYSYESQLDYPDSRITFFKGGEKYRFALQFITDTGYRSQAFWIGDATNPLYPEVDFDRDRSVWSIKRPLAECIVPADIVSKAYSLGYRYVRLMRAGASYYDRGILAQGIVSPTVFNLQARASGSPFAQSSWFFRAKNCEIPFYHLDSVNASSPVYKEGAAICPSYDEIQNITDEYTPAYLSEGSEPRTVVAQVFPVLYYWRTSARMSRAWGARLSYYYRYDSSGNLVARGWGITNSSSYIWKKESGGEPYWGNYDSSEGNVGGGLNAKTIYDYLDSSNSQNWTSGGSVSGSNCFRTDGTRPEFQGDLYTWIMQGRTGESNKTSSWKAYNNGFTSRLESLGLAESWNYLGTISANDFSGSLLTGFTPEDVMENPYFWRTWGFYIFAPGYVASSISQTAEQEFVNDNSVGFFVDESIVTFNTPEQINLEGTDIADTEVRFIGIAPVTAISSVSSLQFGQNSSESSPTEVSWATNVSNSSSGIQSAMDSLRGTGQAGTSEIGNFSGLVSAPRFYSPTNSGYPVVYPWYKEGSVSEDSDNSEDIVEKNVLGNRRYSYFTEYLSSRDSDGNWINGRFRPLSASLADFRWITSSDYKFYSVMTPGHNRVYSPSSNMALLRKEVSEGNEISIGDYPVRMLTDEYSAGGAPDRMRTEVLGTGPSPKDKASDSVLMYYRGTPHGVISLGRAEGSANIQLIPVLYHNEIGSPPEGILPWDTSVSSSSVETFIPNTISKSPSELRDDILEQDWNIVQDFVVSDFYSKVANVTEGMASVPIAGRSFTDGSGNTEAYIVSPSEDVRESSCAFLFGGEVYSLSLSPEFSVVKFPEGLAGGASIDFTSKSHWSVTWTHSENSTRYSVRFAVNVSSPYGAAFRNLTSFVKVRMYFSDSTGFYSAVLGSFDPSAAQQQVVFTADAFMGTQLKSSGDAVSVVIYIDAVPVVASMAKMSDSGTAKYSSYGLNSLLYMSNPDGGKVENMTESSFSADASDLSSFVRYLGFTEEEIPPGTDLLDFISTRLNIESENVETQSFEQEVSGEYDRYGNLQYPYLVVAELGSDYPDENDPRYGGPTESAASSNTFYPTGDLVKMEDGKEAVLTGTSGDTFIQRYDVLKTLPYDNGHKNNLYEMGSFLLETHVNLDGRSDSNIGSPAIDSFSEENINLVNPVYSDTSRIDSAAYLPSTFDVYNYPTNVVWSSPKVFGEEIDSWTSIRQSDSISMDGEKGNVRKLARFNNSLICFQDRGIAEILYNTRTQMSTAEGVPVELMNSGKVDGKRYITNKSGCLNKWSVVETRSGIYFIDNLTSSISVFNGNVESLSDARGFKEWIGNHNRVDIWNPEDFGNFVSFWDRINDDVYFVGKDCCLVYNEQLAQFTSFMDYHGVPMMTNVNDRFISFRNGDLWAQGEGDYNMFFGDARPYHVEYRITPDPYGDKIFTNLEYRADIVDSDGNLTGHTFDHIVVSDEYQSNSADMDYSPYGPSDLKKKFRIWRVNIPRSHRSEGNPYGLDRMRNPWIKVRLSKNENLDRNEVMEFHDLLVRYYE